MENKVMTISGLPGAGSSITARALADKLLISFFSAGQFFKDIGRGSVERQKFYPEFKHLIHKYKLELPRLSSENDSEAVDVLWKNSVGQSESLHQAIDELQSRLAEQGNIIIEGKLAIKMVGNAKLKVWLNASMEERIDRISKRDRIGRIEARENLTSREITERKEWQRIYKIDYFDLENQADLVIDTSNVKLNDVLDLIILKFRE